MTDAGFEVPAAKRARFTSSYRVDAAGGLELADAPDGQWRTLPAFPLGNGGLAGTADDWLAFAEMDRRGAEVLLTAVPPALCLAAFHCQQAVGKLLKKRRSGILQQNSG